MWQTKSINENERDVSSIKGEDKFVDVLQIETYKNDELIQTEYSIESYFFRCSELDSENITDNAKAYSLNKMLIALDMHIEKETNKKLHALREKIIEEMKIEFGYYMLKDRFEKDLVKQET